MFKTYLLVTFLTFVLVPNAKSQTSSKILYVKEDSENLRKYPNGDLLGTVNQKTKLEIIEEDGNWVKVSLIGWIFKPSLTDDLSKIVEETKPKMMHAGSDFYYKNVNFKSTDYGVDVIGEIINQSNKYLQFSSFTLSVYDENDKLLDTAPIIIMSFSPGMTKSFQTSLLQTSNNQIALYKIQFDSGF